MSMERGTQLKSGSIGKLLNIVFEKIGKRLKLELGSRSRTRFGTLRKRLKKSGLGSRSRGKLLKELDTIFEEIREQLKSELESSGKGLKESGSRWEELKEFEERRKKQLASELESGVSEEERWKQLALELESESGVSEEREKQLAWESQEERWKQLALELESGVSEERGKELSLELGWRSFFINNTKQEYEDDAITPPPEEQSVGGLVPCMIDDHNRSTLISHSELALKVYNQKNNQAFVFHQLVECDTGNAVGRGDLYDITFQAKAKEEDPFNSPAITTFRARVWKSWDATEPKVYECAIVT